MTTQNLITTRRSFLKAGAVGTGALLTGGVSAVMAESKKAVDQYGGFKLGLQSYSLRGYDAKNALKHTRDLGLHYWESFRNHIPVNTLPKHVAEQQKLLAGYDVKLMAFGVENFDGNETRARELFDFGKAMGVKAISAYPKKDNKTFDLLDKLVEEYGIAIAIHNHGPGSGYDKISDVEKVVKDRHPLVGACVDTGHYLRSNESPVDAIKRFGKRVFGVHLKDVKGYATDADAAAFIKTGKARRQLKNEQKFFTLLGEGDLDVVCCLQLLRQLKYENIVSLEYEENKDNPLSDIAICLDAVRKAVKQLG
ncbi:MAG: TIM barrel protein [Planctomycetaceae bacterium]|nr:TIM barrel protein [Planctomycetaceae bacterium]MBT6154672.1 TIM barrel protein [Planctomycetaceae bacterium]MBT6484748.1 TIM barrel protein [Planctomycetaceae bacterium]MBT6494154.1 TIM barrel protein [Planctomycetaceae bacterium]